MAGALIKLIAAIVLVVATNALHTRIPPTSRSEEGDAFVPRPEFAKAVALGFHAVLADYYWLQAVQIVGDPESRPGRRSQHIGRLMDVVTTVDPWVSHPYRFAAVWLTDSEEAVRHANRLLARAIAYQPHDWRNYFYKGFNHFFYLGEYAEAADELEIASQLGELPDYPGPPAYLGKLAGRLRSHASGLDSAEIFLRQMLADARDEDAKATYQGSLDELEVERKARFLDHARVEYRKARGRDIERVEDLASGPRRVMSALPDPEPDSLPRALKRGSSWLLDADSDKFVSSYYGRRYELHASAFDQQMLEGFRSENQESEKIQDEG